MCTTPFGSLDNQRFGFISDVIWIIEGSGKCLLYV